MRYVVRVVALALLAPAIVLAACGGDDDSASDAAEAVFRQYINQEYEQAWQALHPAHQEIAPQLTFVGCQMDTTPPWDDVSISGEHTEIYDAPEIGQLETKAVDVRLTRGDDVDVQSGSLHLVEIDGQWRWLLDEETARAFKEGRCP